MLRKILIENANEIIIQHYSKVSALHQCRFLSDEDTKEGKMKKPRTAKILIKFSEKTRKARKESDKK